jgi:phospholipase/carboxylesterase
MRQEQLGELDVRLVGENGSGPLLVLMHGYGAPGTDLVDLARMLSAPSPIRFAFPAAPLPIDGLGPDARAWWPIDLVRLQGEYLPGRTAELWRREPPGLDTARGQVTEMLSSLLESTGIPSRRLVLGGFSQGAILACDVAFRSEFQLGGLVVLSGAPVAEAIWTRLLPAKRDLPVFQSHGVHDPILPFTAGLHLRELMSAAGLAVEFTQFGGGHGIPLEVLGRLSDFLGRIADGSS